MPTFRTPYDQYRHRNGDPYQLLSWITEPDQTHDSEVLPMARIRFGDGIEIEAWPEEVEESAPQ